MEEHMNYLKYKIIFSASIVLFTQFFVMPQSGYTYEEAIMSVNPKYQNSIGNNEDQSQVNEIPYTSGGQSGGSTNQSENKTSYSAMVDSLGDCDLSTKCMVLKSSGATSGQAATVLAGKGYATADVVKSLANAGFDTTNTSNFLSGVSKGADPQQSGSNNNNNVTTTTVLGANSTQNNGTVTTVINGSGLGSSNTQVVTITSGNSEDPSQQNIDPNSQNNKTQVGDVTVNDTRSGKANAEDIAKIKQQLVDAQKLFANLGFDAKKITVDIVDEDGSGKGAEAGIGKDGSIHINFYVSNGKDGHYTQGGGELQTGGLIHEYAHLVYETQTGGGFSHETNATDVNQAQALNEGFALYWGEGQNGKGLPDLAGTAQDTPQKNADVNFAKALTSLAKDIGYDKANALVMSAYSLMDGNFTFAGAMDALIKADQKLYGGANAQNINNALGRV
jgi:hypothetical protein